MRDMPKSAEKYYKWWISAFPETRHPNDLERFYMFVSVLLKNARNERTRHWLESNLQEDCPKLSQEDIEYYCDIYTHIKDYENVWKSQQARLIVQDEIEKSMKAAREKYS